MLENISQQINNLAQYVEARFNRLEDMLSIVHEQMHGRFDRIEDMLGQIYSEMQKQFQNLSTEIKELGNNLDKKLSNIQIKLDDMSDVLNKMFKLDTHKELKPFFTLKHDIKRLENEEDRGERQQLAKKYASSLIDWVDNEKNRIILTGELQEEKFSIMLDTIKTFGIVFILNPLVYMSNIGIDENQNDNNKLLKIKTPLTNPVVWVEAVDAYLQMFKTYGVYLYKNYDKDIEIFKNHGIQINAFIRFVRQNKPFLFSLTENYLNAVKIALNCLGKNKKDEKEDEDKFKNAIDALNKAYSFLAVFIGLAFENTLLIDYLPQLLNSVDVRYYQEQLTKEDSTKNIELIIDILNKNIEKTIEEFEQLLVKEIIKSQKNEIGHPLIHKMIQELGSFKEAYWLFEDSNSKSAIAIESFEKLVLNAINKNYKFNFKRLNEYTLTITCTEAKEHPKLQGKIFIQLENQLKDVLQKMNVSFGKIESALSENENNFDILTITADEKALDAIVKLIQDVSGKNLNNGEFLFFKSTENNSVTENKEKQKKEDERIVGCSVS